MTQYQYDTIMKVISNGAPALANELCESIASVVRENIMLKDELSKLKDANVDENANVKTDENEENVDGI